MKPILLKNYLAMGGNILYKDDNYCYGVTRFDKEYQIIAFDKKTGEESFEKNRILTKEQFIKEFNLVKE